jgi:ABC-type transporter MlaC component
MKGFILGTLVFVSVSGVAGVVDSMHPASQFVDQSLTRAKQILQHKDENYRRKQMCQLLKTRIYSSYVASVWLGDYGRLQRDRAGIKAFTKLIPSILLNKGVQAIGGGGDMSGSFSVNPDASERGHGYFDVGLTIRAGQDTYNATALVLQTKDAFLFVDIEYMGFSAVQYGAREYQNMFKEEYNRDPNRSLPVSAVVKRITSSADFVRCP